MIDIIYFMGANVPSAFTVCVWYESLWYSATIFYSLGSSIHCRAFYRPKMKCENPVNFLYSTASYRNRVNHVWLYIKCSDWTSKTFIWQRSNMISDNKKSKNRRQKLDISKFHYSDTPFLIKILEVFIIDKKTFLKPLCFP